MPGFMEGVAAEVETGVLDGGDEGGLDEGVRVSVKGCGHLADQVGVAGGC